MKKSIISAFYLFSLLTLAACSSEESVENGGSIDAAKDITFEFSEESFQPGKVFGPGTRAAQTSQIFDLGNGMIAEATLEPDSSCMKQTRASGTTISDGEYKIYAVDNATNTRYDGLEGTIANGKFTPKNPNAKWQLAPGNYTFVCYNVSDPTNPNIVDQGSSLMVKHGGNSMMGVTEHTINAGDKVYRVPFVMRHLEARVRIQVDSYTAPMKNAHIQAFQGDATDGGVRTFDLKGNETSRSTVGFPSLETDFESTPAYNPSDKTREYKNISKGALYFADGASITIAAPVGSVMFPFTWTSTSTLYGKSLNDVSSKGQNLGSVGGQVYNITLQKNYSYTWHFKIRPAVLYLYSDGTVGTIGDKDNRIPIGVVINEKQTDSDKGMAIALNQSTGSTMMVQDFYSGQFRFHNDDGTVNNMEGYEITYTTNYYNSAAIASRGEQVPTVPPSELEPLYAPTIYYAAHYQPAGVTTYGANVGKWFLPSAGQMKLFLERYGKAEDSDMPTHFNNRMWTYTNGVDYNHDKIDKAFTAAGGIAPSWHIALSGTDGHNHPVNVALRNNKIYWTYDDSFTVFMNSLECRPFVFF